MLIRDITTLLSNIIFDSVVIMLLFLYFYYVLIYKYKKYNLLPYLYAICSICIVIIVGIGQTHSVYINNSKINYYRKCFRLNKNKLSTDILLSHADNRIIKFLNGHNKRVYSQKYLIIPEMKHRFIILASHKKNISRSYNKILFHLQGPNFSTESFLTYNQSQKTFHQHITEPIYKFQHNNIFASTYCNINHNRNLLFDDGDSEFPLFSTSKVYLSQIDSEKDLTNMSTALSQNINNLSSNKKYYQNEYIHKKKDNVAKYINLGNFWMFMYLGIDLIIILLFGLIILLVLFLWTYINNYLYVSRLFFIYSLEEILDEYIFKITPLIIAVMSGIVIVYFKGTTPYVFKLFIKYTIPLFSSIQFIRISVKILDKLSRVIHNRNLTN